MEILPVLLVASPTVSVTSTGPPRGTVAGTMTFTCRIPAARLGADPAYVTVAGRPPMRTVTGRTGCASVEPTMLPVTPFGFVCPSPVAYSVTIEPGSAPLAD